MTGVPVSSMHTSDNLCDFISVLGGVGLDRRRMNMDEINDNNSWPVLHSRKSKY